MEMVERSIGQALPESWVERLFDRMLFTFGKKFTDQWSCAEPQRLVAHWAAEMAGFSGEEIKRGLTAMEGLDWPPTLPHFKRLCRPAVDATPAYYEAVEGVRARQRGEVGTWSHPAIYWASTKLAYDLMSLPFNSIKDRWQAALQAELAKGQWDEIPQPSLPLPAPDPLSKEDAAARMADLQATQVAKPMSAKVNHRAWINKVLARAKAKDSSLPNISIQFAKQATAVADK